jgi:histidinol-phosphate/aromatic aminotransferase/cobyric acid decarboxylase-like protein
VYTCTSETCFLLADFTPQDAAHLSEEIRARGILIKPLNEQMPGNGFMRITTALQKE